jgi:hypothetical protein
LLSYFGNIKTMMILSLLYSYIVAAQIENISS